MKKRILITLMLGFVAVASCLAGDKKIEQAVRDLDAQWSKAAETRDLDKLLSFYSNDAMVLPAHNSIATTRDSIQSIFKNLLAVPGINLSWKATKVDVAASGEIAYTVGTYLLTAPDDTGKTTTDRGKYVAVWKKQPDGSWKVATDIWNSDIPIPTTAPATSEKK